MKKIVLVVVFLVATNIFSQENELNIGVNGGVTIGDIEPIASSAFAIDANYLFDWFEEFYVGPTIGMTYFLPKEFDGIKPDAFIYVPIGGAIRFQSIEDDFYAGLDLGYALGISPEGDNGGIFFKPMVGYNINNNLKLNLFYSAVKKKQPAYGYIGLGLSFNIFGEGNYYSY